MKQMIEYYFDNTQYNILMAALSASAVWHSGR